MAEVQESAPLVGQNFTDEHWRALFGDTPAVVGDLDGSAYGLTLPTGSDTLEVGSATQDSRARVGGFLHRIPAGTTQSLDVPVSTDAGLGRTDLVAVRMDAATFNAEPGPCRLVRIPGVEGSAAVPAYNSGAGTVVDLPLWAVTRKAGQGLNQATTADLRVRSGPTFSAPAGVNLPTAAPLGSRAIRDSREYLRAMVGSSAAWVDLTAVSAEAARVSLSGVRPLYQRGRTTATSQFGGTVYLGSATNSGSAGDWATHVSVKSANFSATTGDEFTLKTAGVYSITVVYNLVGPAGEEEDYGYDVAFEVLAGGAGTGTAGNLPRAWGLFTGFESGGAPLAATRYFSAGTRFRIRVHTNVQAVIGQWTIQIMKVSD